MIRELLRAFFFIFAAEMGDKTQILAMTFATRYRVEKVLLGVLIGSALNHGIAIALGSYLSNVIPINTVQIIAGILFVGFGLWTLKPDEDKEEERTKGKFGPVLTVAMAFFIGELGDKTQLTAMTLATDAKYPLFILFGTVLGMIVTSGFGIFIGSKLGTKIPEFAIKVGSAAIFIFFGTLKLFQTIPNQFINSINISVYFILLSVSIYLLLKPSILARKDKRLTALREVATTLYIQTHEIKKAIENICLGTKHCGICHDKDCIIGFTKRMLEGASEKNEYILSPQLNNIPKNYDKKFDIDKVLEALSMVILFYTKYGYHEDENHVINKVREALEILILGEKIPFNSDIKEYLSEIRGRDINIAEEIVKRVERMKKEMH